MYSDPTQIRSHVVRIRLNDEEHRYLRALVDLTGGQMSTVLREMLLGQARAELQVNDTQPIGVLQGANEVLSVTG